LSISNEEYSLSNITFFLYTICCSNALYLYQLVASVG